VLAEKQRQQRRLSSEMLCANCKKLPKNGPRNTFLLYYLMHAELRAPSSVNEAGGSSRLGAADKRISENEKKLMMEKMWLEQAFNALKSAKNNGTIFQTSCLTIADIKIKELVTRVKFLEDQPARSEKKYLSKRVTFASSEKLELIRIFYPYSEESGNENSVDGIVNVDEHKVKGQDGDEEGEEDDDDEDEDEELEGDDEEESSDDSNGDGSDEDVTDEERNVKEDSVNDSRGKENSCRDKECV
jgi:hypothetical protein